MLKLILFIFVLSLTMSIFAQIVRVEFFFDEDPGLGNATPLAFTGTTDISINTDISTSSLHNGLHFLHIRSKDTSGKWSLVSAKPYFKTETSLVPVSRIEYFFDEDPGLGSAIPLAFSGTINISVNPDIDTESLANGLHYLYIRSMDSSDKWSLCSAKPYFKTGTSLSLVTRIEYFFDDDPGLGNANPISYTGITDISLSKDISTDALSMGLHYLYIRTEDSSGNWSLSSYRPYFKTSASLTQVVKFVWHFTGVGANPNQIFSHTIATPATDLSLDIAPSVSNLIDGNEYQMHFQAVDNLGKASQENVYTFTQNTIPKNLSIEINGTLLTLSWDRIPDADAYKVEVFNQPGALESSHTVTENNFAWTVNEPVQLFDVKAVKNDRSRSKSR